MPAATATTSEPAVPAKSMPLWKASWPVNGSWRSPKYEEMKPRRTGRPSGTICSRSSRCRITVSSTFSCASRSATRPRAAQHPQEVRHLCREAVGSGPPVDGAASKSNSRSSMFAIWVRRLPSASRRITCALTWPIRAAIASMRSCSWCAVRRSVPSGRRWRGPTRPRIGLRHATLRTLAEMHARDECHGQQHQQGARSAADQEAMTQMQVAGLALPAEEQDEIHATTLKDSGPSATTPPGCEGLDRGRCSGCSDAMSTWFATTPAGCARTKRNSLRHGPVRCAPKARTSLMVKLALRR